MQQNSVKMVVAFFVVQNDIIGDIMNKTAIFIAKVLGYFTMK